MAAFRSPCQRSAKQHIVRYIYGSALLELYLFNDGHIDVIVNILTGHLVNVNLKAKQYTINIEN